MSDIIHKIKDAVTHHGHHDKNAHEKIEHKHAHKSDHRNDMDLNFAQTNTKSANDLTGRHPEPDHRDIDGLVHSTSRDAPDLNGPHKDHTNVDINGAPAAKHPPPDLNSSTAETSAKR